jgi:membrane-associated PAP2 superfamily phosphatase
MHNTSMAPKGRTLWLVWGALLALTLLWDWSGLDVGAMHLIGSAEGFALRDHWLLERWLHDRARTVGTAVFIGLWVWALWPAATRPRWRTDRLWIATLVTLNLMVVNLIKNSSLTSCPWDMTLWGGSAEVVSHWRWGVSDGGPGRCFPGGHASAALAFAPWVLALWWPSPGGHTPSPRTARWALGLWLLAVFVTGGTQTLRGAHYPSHTAWTAIVCCGISLLGWSLWQWRQQRRLSC